MNLELKLNEFRLFLLNLLNNKSDLKHLEAENDKISKNFAFVWNSSDYQCWWKIKVREREQIKVNENTKIRCCLHRSINQLIAEHLSGKHRNMLHNELLSQLQIASCSFSITSSYAVM